MTEFFTALEPLLKAFWIIAIPTSVVFFIQTVMTFAGLDAADGVSADSDSNPDLSKVTFQLFSLRNLIHFLLGFSWTGISFYNTIESDVIHILRAFMVGSAFVTMLFFIVSHIRRIVQKNSFRIENALNQIGTVYLTIPENKTGTGKVHISVKGSLHELDAVTEKDKIESSAMVKITRIESKNLVLVERI